jgi:hypothetical protein
MHPPTGEVQILGDLAARLSRTTTSTAPEGNWSGWRYSLECNCTTSAGSRSAIRGTERAWYGPVATTTWSAVSSLSDVDSSKRPVAARRSRVTRTPSRNGGRKEAA